MTGTSSSPAPSRASATSRPGTSAAQPVEARLTGRADPEDAFLAGYEPIRYERQKLADGTWADEPIDRKDHDQQEVEGSTWLAQDQVGEDVAAALRHHPRVRDPGLRAERGMRARRQWRKQEPDEPAARGAGRPGVGERPDRRAARLPDRREGRLDAAGRAHRRGRDRRQHDCRRRHRQEDPRHPVRAVRVRGRQREMAVRDDGRDRPAVPRARRARPSTPARAGSRTTSCSRRSPGRRSS
jgi:hypothetical protein